MPKLRRFAVKYRDGTSDVVMADSLDEAWRKARRKANKQISEREQGRKKVADVAVVPGQGAPPVSHHPDSKVRP